MVSLDAPFLVAARAAVALVTDSQVEARWDDDSALPLMSVGMLACHLGRQVVHARELLQVAPTAPLLDEAADHYRRAPWVGAALQDEANDRSRDEQEAVAGYAALVTRCRSALDGVAELLIDGHPQPVVTIPWQGWSLRRDDFLLTRLVEIVVHSDDLARSVDVPTPHFPTDAFRPVAHLLADLAAERHGQAALVSALSRRERQPENISAF